MLEAELLNLYDKYSNMVYRLAFSYLKSQQDAEDAVQAIFLKLVEGKAQPIPGKERSFLTQITANYCRDQLRSFFRKKSVPLDPEIIFEDTNDQELFNMFMILSQKYRVPIFLHYYEGYSFSEISDFLKISPSAVSMRIHRARKLLKKQLEEANK